MGRRGDRAWGSDKFYDTLLAGPVVATAFGPVGTPTAQLLIKDHGTPAKAQAAWWATLREKCGKGYHVDHADYTDLDLLETEPGTVERWAAQAAVRTYSRQQARCACAPTQPVRDNPTRRTPRYGARLLAALTLPDPGRDTLVQLALAPPTEPWLTRLALAHPACPDDARAAAALAATPLAG